MAGEDHGPSQRQPSQAVQDFALGRRVEMRRGFIQQQQGGILQERPGDRHPLCLAAGQTVTALAYRGIKAVRQCRGDYVTRSWSHALPAGRKRSSLDAIATLARDHDIVGLQEADPGSLRSGFTNQTHYLPVR